MASGALHLVEAGDPCFLRELARRNELELPSDEALGAVTKAWMLSDGEAARGGVCVYLRGGEHVLDLFAVDEGFRGQGYSHVLYDAALGFLEARGARRVFVVTKVPAYFGKKGFREVARDEAPDFSECFACDQYGKSCFPKVMVLDLPRRQRA